MFQSLLQENTFFTWEPKLGWFFEDLISYDFLHVNIFNPIVDDKAYVFQRISEVMHDPSQVADYRGEWFEIYNNTSGGLTSMGW